MYYTKIVQFSFCKFYHIIITKDAIVAFVAMCYDVAASVVRYFYENIDLLLKKHAKYSA